MTRFLEGQGARVTGAGRGRGRAFAEHLAAAGAKVGVHGMREQGPSEYGEGTTLSDTAREIGEHGDVETLRVLADLTDGEAVTRIVDEVTEGLGPIDILVHNAGGDIAAAGGKPDPNDAVMLKQEDVEAVLDRIRRLRGVVIGHRLDSDHRVVDCRVEFPRVRIAPEGCH